MRNEKNILKNAKEAYELLLELYCDLCQTKDLEQSKAILTEVVSVVERIKQYKFFPLSISPSIEASIRKEEIITNNERLSFIQELYERLASLLFRFEEANIESMRPYMNVLEYGRSYIPFHISRHWGKEYMTSPKSINESFYFHYVSQFYPQSKQERQDYALHLREDISAIKSVFPKEKNLPRQIREEITKIVGESQRTYQAYVEKHYASIKHLFAYYNKRIRLYLHKRNESLWIAMINIYDSDTPEYKVYPKEVNVMCGFHNFEQETPNINTGIICGYGAGFPFLDFLQEYSIHEEVHKIFLRYAKEADLIEYLIYMLRGQMRKVVYNGRDELKIGSDKYLLCVQDGLSRGSIQEIIETNKGLYKGVLFRYNQPREVMAMLKEAGLTVLSVEQLGSDMLRNENGEMIHLYIKERLGELHVSNSDKSQQEAQLLLERLKKCPKGIKFWHEYEEIGTAIFKYLFENEFRRFKYEIQSTTLNGILRRDLIVHNLYKVSPSFLERIKTEFNAKLIIVDFKNYTGYLKTDDFFIVSKYFGKTTGYFAIIFSRNGLDKNAKVYQKDMLNEDKLILCLSDQDVEDMIERKKRNQNPTDLLEDKYCAMIEKG